MNSTGQFTLIAFSHLLTLYLGFFQLLTLYLLYIILSLSVSFRTGTEKAALAILICAFHIQSDEFKALYRSGRYHCFSFAVVKGRRREFPFYISSKTKKWIRIQFSCVAVQCSIECYTGSILTVILTGTYAVYVLQLMQLN